MAYDFYIDRELETGFVRLSCYVDAEQILEAANAVSGDAQWQPHYNSLWDFCPTREVDITLGGLNKILREKKGRDAEGFVPRKIAVMAKRPAIIIVGKLVELRASTTARAVKVFKREKEARKWLGLSQDVDVWEWSRDSSYA